MPSFSRISLILLVFFTAAAHAAAPDVPTDAGRVLKDNLPPPGGPATTPPPALPAPQAPKPATPQGAEDIRVDVSAFNFTGNTVIPTEKLQAAVAEWAGKPLNFGDLIQVTEKVEAVYRDAGYFLAQAVLPPQQIRSGVISIAITEGRLGKMRIEGTSRVSPETWYRYLDQLPAGEVATEAMLDRQALLINELAGASASLDLQAGEAPGTTDVVLMHQPQPLLAGRINVDNHGLPATGEYRLGLNAALNSPLHRGDRLTGNVVLSNTGNLHTYGLRYELPFGGKGWRAYLDKSRAQYSLGGAFSALDASGTADSWRAGVSYPWLRGRKANLNLQLEADYSRLRDVIGSQGLTLGKHSYGLTFTPTFDWQDAWLGGGNNQISLELRHGQLDLGSDSKLLDLPPGGPDADGSFNKISLNLFRQQTINKQIKHSFAVRQQGMVETGFTAFNQFTAVFAAAKTLRLQNTVKGKFAHVADGFSW
jgi:hemolysin activation/secretion protein